MNDSRMGTENQEICVGVLASLLTRYFILSKIYMEITKCLTKIDTHGFKSLDCPGTFLNGRRRNLKAWSETT